MDCGFLGTPPACAPEAVASSRWDCQRFVRLLALSVAFGAVGISLAVADGVSLVTSGGALAVALAAEAFALR